MQFLCRERIHFGKHGMQLFLAACFLCQSIELFSELLIAACAAKAESVHQRLQVKAGTTCKNGQFVAAQDLTNHLFCVHSIISNSIAFRRLHNVQHVMRNKLLLLCRRFGRTNVHTAVDLHGVHTDDLAIQLMGKLQRQLAFAAGSGPCNSNDAW